jgi:hypothetical protein
VDELAAKSATAPIQPNLLIAQRFLSDIYDPRCIAV